MLKIREVIVSKTQKFKRENLSLPFSWSLSTNLIPACLFSPENTDNQNRSTYIQTGSLGPIHFSLPLCHLTSMLFLSHAIVFFQSSVNLKLGLVYQSILTLIMKFLLKERFSDYRVRFCCSCFLLFSNT